MRKIFFYYSMIAVFTTVSCENTTVEQDMDNFCECRRAANRGERDLTDCKKMIDEISDKYQFDPGAVEVIQEKSKACLTDSAQIH